MLALFALFRLLIDALFSSRLTPAEEDDAADEDLTDPVSPVSGRSGAPAMVSPPSQGDLEYGPATPIVRAMLARGYTVFRDNGRPLNLNIVGIRDVTPEWDRFGCRLAIFWEEQGRWTLRLYPFTTYPGDYYSRTKLLHRDGVLIMAPGQYRGAYRLRKHRGLYEALCQDGAPVRVYRDGNRDRVYDMLDRTIQSGYFGANIHAPENPDDGISRDLYESIGSASAGCQVFARVSHFVEARQLWRESARHQGASFTYTLITDADIEGTVEGAGSVTPGAAATLPRDYQAGRAIVDLEARRDANGYPMLYELPANDGGGRWEIAGINERYHPEALAALRALAPEEREAYAARYIEDYTLQVTRLDEIALRGGTRFYVLDTTFNRGAGGSAWIVQRALNSLGHGLVQDGKWGPKTRAALEAADSKQPSAILTRLRAAREEYERTKVGYRANLWTGLVNRWEKALKIAEQWNA